MTKTPICDFVRNYIAERPVRLHMPGHKGEPILGPEPLDITEIDGADDLYLPRGVIAESQRIAGELFGADTYYSAEGSSLCLRAMLFLAMHATEKPRNGARFRLLAGRNAHKTLLYTAALLDFDIEWLHPARGDGYQSCTVTAESVERALTGQKTLPFAVFLTSPDYVGHIADVADVAAVCRAHGVPLLVDNAHGAYLKFLKESRHPIDLGAAMCCDSAHKTLPVLTGGAYLHLSSSWGKVSKNDVLSALSLFGSTSPSYLILQSLDAANPYLATLGERLADFLPHVEALKNTLTAAGYAVTGDEPMKITIRPRSRGYTGDEVAVLLREKKIVVEYHDPDVVVLMPTPQNTPDELAFVGQIMTDIQPRSPLFAAPPPYAAPRVALSPREALFVPRKTVPVGKAVGRILADPAVSCPPAVPILSCGEIVDEAAVERFRYYGIKELSVVK